MRNRPQGFTMIELIVVIVILGVLAATALPKFIDMRTAAYLHALMRLSQALESTGTEKQFTRHHGKE